MAPPAPAGTQERLRALPYLIAGLSFIPLIGLLFGLVAIGWGMATRKAGRRNLVLLGSGGIAFTLVLYGGLFYFGLVQRGGVYDHLRAQLAQSQLNALVPAIEFYKLQRGGYPTSLRELQSTLPKNSFTGVFDPTSLGLGDERRYFFYERVGDDHYYLRGVGPDGRPFTADDIVPQVTIPSGSSIGLLLAPPSSTAPAKP
jgi:hypothetical protein